MELNSSGKQKRKLGALVLVVFALGYLLSSQLRGVTAALAPHFTSEFGISPSQLGLLAGSYFASFAVLQLPMGGLLDRFGVRRVLCISLMIAALASFLFAMADSFNGLFWSRFLSGIGVSACLVAPLTAARLWTTAAQQQRLNSWMLMAGALGLVLGTLPSEGIASTYGWPSLFVALGVAFAVVALLVGVAAPGQEAGSAQNRQGIWHGYGAILRTRYTWSIGILGALNYAILVAVQTLWIGPWLTELGGQSTREASFNLLLANIIMLLVFLVMGFLSPKFNKSADDGERLLRRWTPVSIALLFIIAGLGAEAQWYWFALYCVFAWPLSVTHPLIGQRSKPERAGRAIAFYNLLLFVGVFVWQWSFGLVVAFITPKFGLEPAYKVAMVSLACLSTIGYGYFVLSIKKSVAVVESASDLSTSPKSDI